MKKLALTLFLIVLTVSVSACSSLEKDLIPLEDEIKVNALPPLDYLAQPYPSLIKKNNLACLKTTSDLILYNQLLDGHDYLNKYSEKCEASSAVLITSIHLQQDKINELTRLANASTIENNKLKKDYFISSMKHYTIEILLVLLVLTL